MSACFIIGYSACSGKRKTFPDLRFRGDCALCYCDKIFNAVVGLKNTQYQRAAINRARFLLSEEILLGINEVMNEQEMNLGGIYRMEFLDDLVRIYSSSVMDGNFLYSTTKGCREFAPQDLVTKEPDFFKRQEKIRRITEKMENILSRAKIERYVERQLGEKKQAAAQGSEIDDWAAAFKSGSLSGYTVGSSGHTKWAFPASNPSIRIFWPVQKWLVTVMK